MKKIKKVLFGFPFVPQTLLLATLVGGGIYFFVGGQQWFELLTRNEALSKALANLTIEEQLGFLERVETTSSATNRSIQVRLTLTDPVVPEREVWDQVFTFSDNTVYLDTITIKFLPERVMDGKARALHLWQKMYDETIPPEQGISIQPAFEQPPQYATFTDQLPRVGQDLFWREMWNLAHDPDALAHLGIQAIYGNAIYTEVQPGYRYVIKSTPQGQLFFEIE